MEMFLEINIMNVQIKYWHCFTWKERYSNVFKVGREGVHSLYVRLFELLLNAHSVNFLIRIMMNRSFASYQFSLLMM